MMRNKLGLFKERKEDEKLIFDLLKWMESFSADYTNTFNDLLDNNILNKNFIVIDARSKDRFEGKVKEPRKGLRSGSIPVSYTHLRAHET